MKFRLNSDELELTAEQVRDRLSGVLPGRVRHHGVRVDGRLFPVKQAFEVATGRPRDEFTTQAARQHLAALGFEVTGEIEPGEGPEAPAAVSEELWHTEAATQAALVTHLTGEGWDILAVGDPLTGERGIGVLAERDGRTVAVEVKGYPTRRHTGPARSREGRPGTLGVHWYAQAVLAAMRTRSRRPGADAIIALPDVERYQDLFAETVESLSLSGIEVWWVGEDGRVSSGILQSGGSST